MLGEDLLGVLVGKQIVAGWLRQSLAEAAREVDGDAPVITGFARRGHGRHDVGDPPFRIGDRPLLLAPAACRQQEIGKGGGIGVRVSLLENDEGRSIQGGAHLRLRR